MIKKKTKNNPIIIHIKSKPHTYKKITSLFTDENPSPQACFDVRESSNTWGALALDAELRGEAESDWLSTHPSDTRRQEHLDAHMQEALVLRSVCQVRRRESGGET